MRGEYAAERISARRADFAEGRNQLEELDSFFCVCRDEISRSRHSKSSR